MAEFFVAERGDCESMIKVYETGNVLFEDMILIPEGTFLMGSTKEDIEKLLEQDKSIETYRLNNEIPQREIFLSAYYIDKYLSPMHNFLNLLRRTGIKKSCIGQKRDGSMFLISIRRVVMT